MLCFENDYSEGAHPKILERLAATNMEHLVGYGQDDYCKRAAARIKKAIGKDDAVVHFISGGTQTNELVIAATLKNYEGVVAAMTGHINGHEAGAVEYTGHKVLPLPGHEGKIHAAELKQLLATFYADANHEHMVYPGMVYLSHPTEYGTLYTKKELTAIAEICRDYKIPLFLDGARLGYGLVSPGTDVTLRDLADLCDVFYIGGTKVGALLGEAVVFPNGNAPEHFYTQIKQHGAMLAKGRVLGIQFDVLFEDDLYETISKNAIETADRLRSALRDKGYRFFLETVTNQIFVVLENEQMKTLGKKVRFGFWERFDDNHTVVRFATSWATSMDDVEKLIELL